MFPDAHTQAESNMFIHISTDIFHTSYFEIINPASNELIKFLNLIAIAHAPATTSEFFHSHLELRY